MRGIIGNFSLIDLIGEKIMKGNLSKTKLTRIVICILMIATILQVTAISMVQATSENIEQTLRAPLPPEDFVRTNNQDVDFIKPEDGSDLGITSIKEPTETLPPTEDLPTTEDQIVDFVRPEDGSEIGNTQIDVLPENSDLIGTDDQEVDFVKHDDGSDIGITEIGKEENSQPLIAPKTTTETGSPITAAATLLVALGTIATVFIAISHKNQSKQ
jgi:hypothetical protein